MSYKSGIVVLFLLLIGAATAKAQACGGWRVRAAIVDGKNQLIKDAELELINVDEKDDGRKVKFQKSAADKFNLVGSFYEGGNYASVYEARVFAAGYDEKIIRLPIEDCRTNLTPHRYVLKKSGAANERREASSVAAKKKLIQDKLADAYAKGEFSGVVLAAKNDDIIFSGAIGKSNRPQNIDNRLAAKFRICSVTKQFTALLVMQLVEQGKINLDAPIREYLPQFGTLIIGYSIKVRDLLNNTSGLPLLPDDFYADRDARAADANFVVGKYLTAKLLSDPGLKFNYNNADYIFLGAIIERVSGKSYEQNLREKILVPLGMKNSGLLTSEKTIENLASGYTFKNGAYQEEDFTRIENYGAAGAMYSTAEDLLSWDRALMSYKLLSKKYTDEMFKPYETLGYVAFGSWSYPLKLRGAWKTIVERQGHINGFCALNLIVPEENLAVIFLSNTETETLFQTYAGNGLSFEILKAVAE